VVDIKDWRWVYIYMMVGAGQGLAVGSIHSYRLRTLFFAHGVCCGGGVCALVTSGLDLAKAGFIGGYGTLTTNLRTHVAH
jgi:hypothetical protein